MAKAFAAQHWKPSPKSNCPQFGGLRVLRGGCSGREVRYSGQHLPVNSVGSSHGSVHRPRRIRFTRAMTFVASWFTHLLRSASLLAPCTDLTGCPASGAFTSRLPAGWSPFQLQDITTTATGLLCWRDSHPLEWQLASLHLLLHPDGLPPSTFCRSPGAPVHPISWRKEYGGLELDQALAPGRRRRSPAPGSHRTWRADFPHHALRQLVRSFHCYLFKFRFHGQLIFSLSRRP